MFTTFQRFLGLSTKATKQDVYELAEKLQTTYLPADLNSHPYLIASVQTFAERREVTMTCRKTQLRIARVSIRPGQKPDINWGVRWN